MSSDIRIRNCHCLKKEELIAMAFPIEGHHGVRPEVNFPRQKFPISEQKSGE
jgi:hypothetical protein